MGKSSTDPVVSHCTRKNKRDNFHQIILFSSQKMPNSLPLSFTTNALTPVSAIILSASTSEISASQTTGLAVISSVARTVANFS